MGARLSVRSEAAPRHIKRSPRWEFRMGMESSPHASVSYLHLFLSFILFMRVYLVIRYTLISIFSLAALAS